MEHGVETLQQAQGAQPAPHVCREEAAGQVGGLRTSTHLFGLEDSELSLRDEHTAGGRQGQVHRRH